MNSACLIGRLTRDPEVRYGAQSQMAVARFSIAIERKKDKNGESGTDYPNIVCFGKTAENVEKYVSKGQLIGVSGHIQTGSYEKNGQKYYTTEVVADRIDFLSKKDSDNKQPQGEDPGFMQVDDDEIPF